MSWCDRGPDGRTSDSRSQSPLRGTLPRSRTSARENAHSAAVRNCLDGLQHDVSAPGLRAVDGCAGRGVGEGECIRRARSAHELRRMGNAQLHWRAERTKYERCFRARGIRCHRISCVVQSRWSDRDSSRVLLGCGVESGLAYSAHVQRLVRAGVDPASHCVLYPDQTIYCT